MKLTNEQKWAVENYLKHNVLYEKLTLELINKTIYDLYNLLKIPGMQIFYKPYFGSCEDPCPTGKTNTFTIVLSIQNEVGVNAMYQITISPVSESPVVSIKQQ